ncbi:MAG: hypothetical protein Q9219_006985 [cf. Caloplaca sp. 3 TL-2023]
MTSIVFSAYTFTTKTSSKDMCLTTSHVTTLDDPFTVSTAAAVNASRFLFLASSSFLSYIQYPCGDIPQRSVSLSAALTQPSSLVLATPVNPPEESSERLANSTSPPNSGSTSSSAASLSSSGLSPGAKGGLAAGIVLATIAILMVLFLCLKRYRKHKREHQLESQLRPTEEDQPYLQRKAELDAEDRRRHELHGKCTRYELDGNNDISEMATTANNSVRDADQRIELRGEEHCKELGAEEFSDSTKPNL